MNDLSITAIELPEELSSIGPRAFAGCAGLISLTIPDSVTLIGENAFDGCVDLTLLVNSGSYAEQYCIDHELRYQLIDAEPYEPESNFYTVDNPDGTVKILSYLGSSARVVIPPTIGGKPVFEVNGFGYSGIVSVVVPKGVKRIGDWAFSECTNLTSVSLPEGLQEIGEGAFILSGIERVSIPWSVTEMGEFAFSDCASLTSVELPEGSELTEIPDSAFGDCSSLNSIRIPEGVTSIGGSAFTRCKSLTEFSFPSTLETIGSFAFQDCDALTEVLLPEGLMTIQRYAFSMCDRLTSAYIPASVTSIGECAFDSVSGTFTVAAGSYAMHYCYDNNIQFELVGTYCDPEENFTCEEWEDGAMRITGYTGDSSIVFIPDTMDGKPVTAIAEYAFAGNSQLGWVSIPGSVKEIGHAAFNDCNYLKSVYLSYGLERIGAAAFSYTGVRSVYLPESVKYIEREAFSGRSLTDINLPAAILEIGDSAFLDCDGLTATVTEGTYAEAYCVANGINHVSVRPTEPGENFTTEQLNDGTLRITGYTGTSTDLVIPARIEGKKVVGIASEAFAGSSLTSVCLTPGIQTIGAQAFRECASLTGIELSEGLTEIGSKAFWLCPGPADLVLPDGLKTIGSSAFASGGHIESVFIPDTVTSIGEDAFAGCADNLAATVYVGSYAEQYCVDNSLNHNAIELPPEKLFVWAPSYPGGPYFITAYLGSAADVVIPAELKGDSIFGIGGAAFTDLDTLTSVVISEGISYMPDGAFDSCPNLVSVTLPASMNDIGTEAFRDCPNAVFTVISGSYAEQYCIDTGRPYVTVG